MQLKTFKQSVVGILALGVVSNVIFTLIVAPDTLLSSHRSWRSLFSTLSQPLSGSSHDALDDAPNGKLPPHPAPLPQSVFLSLAIWRTLGLIGSFAFKTGVLLVIASFPLALMGKLGEWLDNSPGCIGGCFGWFGMLALLELAVGVFVVAAINGGYTLGNSGILLLTQGVLGWLFIILLLFALIPQLGRLLRWTYS